MKLRVAHTDDYLSGPYLQIEDEDGECSEDHDWRDIEIEPSAQYKLYYLNLSICDTQLLELAGFDSKDTAIQCTKEQYYHATGNFPVIDDGLASGYRSTGERPESELSARLVPPTDYDSYEYLLISNGVEVEAHSLSPYAEW